MFNKLGQGLRWLGEKTSNAASWLGHKVGGALTAISPAVAHFNFNHRRRNGIRRKCPKRRRGSGGRREGHAERRDFNSHAIRRTVDGIRSDAGAVTSAYSAFRGAAGNQLERGR